MVKSLKSHLRSVVAAGLVAAAPALADSQAVRFYEDAVSRFNAGDTKGALIQLKNSLQHDPTQLPARVLMGRIQLDLGNPLQAEEELVMAGKLGADRSLIGLPLARARNQLGKHKVVIDGLRPIDYPPGIRADLWVELGKARLGTGDHFGADIAFDEALKQEPLHAEASLGKARGLVQQGEYEHAAALIGDVLSAHPENADAWFLMGSAYHAQGELAGAATHFNRARELDPTHYGAKLGEAAALIEDGRPEQAMPLLQELFGERPSSLKVGYLYARTLKVLDREADAQAIIRQVSDVAKSITPADLGDDTEQLLLAAVITFENGEYEISYGFLDAYRQYRADDVWAGRLLATLLLKLKKPYEASRVLGRLAAANPDDPNVLIMLGDVSVELHDYMRAEWYYRSALELVDADASLVSRIGLLQYRQGEALRAIETLKDLVERTSSTGGGASLFLGILYTREGQFAEAGALVERVVAEDPGNLVARNLQAVIAIAQGRRDDGRRILEAALDHDPLFRPARMNLVKLDIKEARFGEAEQALKRILEQDADDIQALHGLAELAVAQERRAEAITYLEKVRQLDRAAQKPIVDLVNLYLRDNQKDRALVIARSLALELPRSVPAQLTLAQVQLARGEVTEARQTLAAARTVAGENPRSLLSVALLQVRAVELDDARNSLETVVQRRPDWTTARIQLAHLLFRQRQFEAAELHVQKILKDSPDHVQAITLMADIKMLEGRPDEAAAIYRQAQQLADIPDIAIRLHRATARAGEAEQALEELQAWQDAHPDTPAVMRLLALLRYRAGDMTAAQHLYERLIDLNPDDASAHNNLAAVLEGSDTERALQAAMRAYELAPDNAAILDRLGWMLVQLGDLDRALMHLREAAARESRSAEIRYHLGVALAEYGKTDDALQELKRALELNPDFSQAQDTRDRLRDMQARSQ